MTPFRMLDLLGEGDVRLTNGLVRITLPADGFLVLAPEIHPEGGYSSYSGSSSWRGPLRSAAGAGAAR